MARSQVNFRIGDEKREKWQSHVEESADYDKLSDLIKIAVREQIRRDRGDVGGGTQSVEANGRIDSILAGVESNGDALESLETELRQMREIVASQGGVSDAVASAVFDALPTPHFPDGEFDMVEGQMKGATPSDVAETADVSLEEAEVALAQLRRDMPSVRMIMTADADEPTYWRE